MTVSELIDKLKDCAQGAEIEVAENTADTTTSWNVYYVQSDGKVVTLS